MATHTIIKSSKIQSKESDKDDIMNASYGGAFDIEDDMYWTKDDIMEYAYEVEDLLNSKDLAISPYTYTDVYVDKSPKGEDILVVEVQDGEGTTAEYREKIDYRKYKLVNDLVSKLAPKAADSIANEFNKMYTELGMTYDDIESA